MEKIGRQNLVQITVIVPCYNYGIFLKECLNSIVEQTFIHWQCIVVDNGSTDNTKEVVQPFIKTDKRFSYYYLSTKGVSAARNFGISKSEGKYILPLDADDKISKTYLEKGFQILENRNEIKVVYCQASLFGDKSGVWNLPEFSIKHLLIENLIFCSAFFRRSDFDKSKGYNESLITGFEDWDFWLGLINNNNEVYKIPEILFHYRIRKTSRNNSLDLDNQMKLRSQIYKAHKPLYDQNIKIDALIFDYYLEKNKYENIKSSYSYRLGKALLKPLLLFKKITNFVSK